MRTRRGRSRRAGTASCIGSSGLAPAARRLSEVGGRVRRGDPSTYASPSVAPHRFLRPNWTLLPRLDDATRDSSGDVTSAARFRSVSRQRFRLWPAMQGDASTVQRRRSSVLARWSDSAGTPDGASQNAHMDAIYAVPSLLALVAAFIVIRYVVYRQRRLLDQYRKHRARKTRTGGSWKAQSPDTISARSDMRAFEDPSTVIDATTTRRDDLTNQPARAIDRTQTKQRTST
jgi:hypothetical protein